MVRRPARPSKRVPGNALRPDRHAISWRCRVCNPPVGRLGQGTTMILQFLAPLVNGTGSGPPGEQNETRMSVSTGIASDDQTFFTHSGAGFWKRGQQTKWIGPGKIGSVNPPGKIWFAGQQNRK